MPCRVLSRPVARCYPGHCKHASHARGSISAAEELLTKRDVARTLKASVRTVERRVASGALPVIRSAGLVRFDPADVADYLDSCRAAPGGAHEAP